MFLHFSCPIDRFEILWHQWQWNPFVFGWLWLLSSLRTWTMAKRSSLTNIPKGLDYEKTRLLPLSVRSTSMIGRQKVPRVSSVPRIMSLLRSNWPPLAISKRPRRGSFWSTNPGILLKYKPNEYRWQGTMKALEFDENGNLLYKFAADAHKIVWVGRKPAPNV